MNEWDIAVIGMAGRFPGAANIDQLWDNLCNGVEAVTFFDDAQLAESGVSPSLWKNPEYVKASAVLDEIDSFDSFFFGYSPAEAAMMDPQHRLFMECAWEALENAGYSGRDYKGMIGVYAGTGMNTYVHNQLASNKELMQAGGGYHVMVASDKDFLATKTSYKLNLKGPSITLQTACSTSLVAVHMACQSIRNGECDMALAGGVSLRVPHKAGYLYQEGIVLSPDGHCRAFDAKAGGTVIGNGAGIVVLKLLTDALEQGDNILAVIKGSAINNDGSRKAGYTAPGLEAQEEVIREAQGVAGVTADTITYVETHGTGTPIGDPIEISALAKAFAHTTDKKGYCAIGSIKTNIGHLDAAAGVAGLIKTVLALKHRKIPKSLNFETPNPRIDFNASPFYVSTSLSDWKTESIPRRAGVSSFGIGGTNAHVVLEEATSHVQGSPSSQWQSILLSAKTEAALEALREKMVQRLMGDPHINLADVAYTLKVGRQSFGHRLLVMASSREEAIERLEKPEPPFSYQARGEGMASSVVFMFTGQGSQYAGMGKELYESVPSFTACVDRCAQLLLPHLGLDLRKVMFPTAENREEADTKLAQTALAQPALFVLEYALASLLMEWGVMPKAMIGHSIGEYVAATLAGVFSLEDALVVVAARGELMQRLPAGSMLAVSKTEEELLPLLPQDVSIGVINSTSMCVVSGVTQSVDKLQQMLEQQNVPCRRLHTSHAFHSVMMEDALPPFIEVMKSISLSEPKIPYISNVSGTWIKTTEAIDPFYWAQHLRQTVRFSQGVQKLFTDPDQILLEIGPGRTLSTLVMQNREKTSRQLTLSTLPGPRETQSDELSLLTAVGRLWLGRFPVDWGRFYGDEMRHRVPLPTYPFERQRHWVDGVKVGEDLIEVSDTRIKKNMEDWFYVPSWKQIPLCSQPVTVDGMNVLVFAAQQPLCGDLIQRIRSDGGRVVVVKPGSNYEVIEKDCYTVRSGTQEDYDKLFKELETQGLLPDTIFHMWQTKPVIEVCEEVQESKEEGFYSLLALAKAIGSQPPRDRLRIFGVVSGIAEVTGEEVLAPHRATILGTLQIIPQEFPYITCKALDVVLSHEQEAQEMLVERLLQEISEVEAEPYSFVAYRGRHRWLSSYASRPLQKPAAENLPFKEKGVYVITGGLGGIGLALARYLAENYKARLVLVGRRTLNDPKRHKLVGDLEAKGAEVLVLQGDIAQEEDVQRMMEEILQRFSGVCGVIHAAGIPGGGLIQLKERESAEKVFNPKLTGTLLLVEALRPLKPDFLLLCSSINSVTGRVGQVDYAAANTFLDVFASTSLPFHVLTINWETWRESGMAARMITPEETVLGDPLLDKITAVNQNRYLFSTFFTMSNQWELHEHGVMGKPTLPGTAYLEMARAAYSHIAGGQAVEMSDVYFLTPLILEGEEEAVVQTVLQKKGEGFTFVMSSQHNQAEHARGYISTPADQRKVSYDVEEMKKRLSDSVLTQPLDEKNIGMFKLERKRLERIAGQTKVPVDALVVTEQQGNESRSMEFGPRWSNLKQVWLGEKEALAWFELPQSYIGDIDVYGMHPALLDFATSFLRLFQSKASYLPLSYKKMSLYKPLPHAFFSYARYADKEDTSGKTLTCHVTLMDQDGDVLADIQEFTVMRVDAAQKLGEHHSMSLSPVEEVAAASELTDMIREDIALGLSDDEGIEVFIRIMASGFPRVVVSTRDLDARIRHSHKVSRGMVEEQKEQGQVATSRHPRPTLYTEYAAPRNEREQGLADIWQEVLGIEQVGVHDNFFELGGDSLLIAKVHARYREKWNEEVSVAQFLQHPTIAEFVQSLQLKKQEQPDMEKQLVEEKASLQKAALKKQRERLKSMR